MHFLLLLHLILHDTDTAATTNMATVRVPKAKNMNMKIMCEQRGRRLHIQIQAGRSVFDQTAGSS